MCRQPSQHVTQVCERVDAQVLARRREAEQYCRRSAAGVPAHEQPVEAADPDQLQRPLTHVIVDVQVAIGGVPLQRLPLIEHVWLVAKVLQPSPELQNEAFYCVFS
jgi:hypothetical protein